MRLLAINRELTITLMRLIAIQYFNRLTAQIIDNVGPVMSPQILDPLSMSLCLAFLQAQDGFLQRAQETLSCWNQGEDAAAGSSPWSNRPRTPAIPTAPGRPSPAVCVSNLYEVVVP